MMISRAVAATDTVYGGKALQVTRNQVLLPVQDLAELWTPPSRYKTVPSRPLSGSLQVEL